MMENPNLIRRPIRDQGRRRSIFGFDKDQYGNALTCASARRAGTIRPARARGTASSIRRPRRRPKGFDELAFYAEHFDTVEVNSTFYGQPRAEVTRAWAERTPPRLRVLGQALSEVHAPADVQGRARRSAAGRCSRGRRRCSTRWRGPTTSDLDAFRRGIDPLASSGQPGRAARAVSRRASRTRRRRATTSPRCCGAFAGYPVAVELRHRSVERSRSARRSTLLNTFGAAWVQIDEPKFRFSIRQNYLPNVQRLLLHAAARPERRAVVAAREVGGSLQLPLLGRRAEGILRNRGRRAGSWSRSSISTRTIISRRSRSPTPR